RRRGDQVFVDGWCHVAQRRVPPLSMREDCDPLKDCCSHLVVGPEPVLCQELTLQGGEKALHHRVVKAVADRAHGGANAGGGPPPPEAPGGVRAAMIGVMNQPRLRSPLPDRHLSSPSSAARASSVRRWSAMDQPTTRRLNTSRITARERKPSCSVGR